MSFTKTKEYQERLDIAKMFVQKLTPQPLTWYVGGSTARGDFRPDSDIDIIALWNNDYEIPFFEPFHILPKEGRYEIDLQGFAKDWEIFKVNLQLLEDLFPIKEVSK